MAVPPFSFSDHENRSDANLEIYIASWEISNDLNRLQIHHASGIFNSTAGICPPPEKIMSNTYTTREVSEALGIPEATIRSWRYSGVYSAVGRGGDHYIFRLHDVVVLALGARLTRTGFPPGVAFTVADATAGDVVAAIEGRRHRPFVCFLKNGNQTIVSLGETTSTGMAGFSSWSTVAVGDVAREVSDLLAGLRMAAKHGGRPEDYATRPAQAEAVRHAR